MLLLYICARAYTSLATLIQDLFPFHYEDHTQDEYKMWICPVTKYNEPFWTREVDSLTHN